MMDRLGIPDEMPIENKLITGSIEKAQTRVEGYHFDARKHLLEYDDVLNKHREVVYARRREVLETFASTPDKLRDRVIDVIESEVEQIVLFHSSEDGVDGKWNAAEIIQSLGSIVQISDEDKTALESIATKKTEGREQLAAVRADMISTMIANVRKGYERIYDVFEDRASVYNIERGVILRAMDMLWIEHLDAMSALRTGIGLRGYGQRDPLIEYKKEGYDLFQRLLSAINNEITYSFFKFARHAVDMKVQAELAKSVYEKAGIVLSGAAEESKNQNAIVKPAEKSSKLGRNDPCHCGSGKKFKKCHLNWNE
jgi:preprotein translocase subunit SecA